jgi:hypothetical protein
MRRLLRRTRLEATFVQSEAPGVCAPAQRIMCAPTHTNERRGAGSVRASSPRSGIAHLGNSTVDVGDGPTGGRERWRGRGAERRCCVSACLASLIIRVVLCGSLLWSGSLWFSPVEWFSVVLSCGVGGSLWFSPVEWFSVLLRVLLSFFFERDSVIMDEHSQ